MPVQWIGIAVSGVALLGLTVSAPTISEIRLVMDSTDARIRPLESIVIQLRAYGEVVDSEGKSRRVRLPTLANPSFRLASPEGGWLSKPFRYQGPEQEPFYESEAAGWGRLLLGRATQDYVMQDAVLFTAPRKPGRYTIEAELNGLKARLDLTIDSAARSTRVAEARHFGPEARDRGRYRALAENWAPFVAQETWFQPKADYLARFDLDGDWQGADNWDHAEIGSSQAYVYYAAMETGTHWFVIYNFFHPRDYSDKCVAGTCHENDNEGIILTIRKDGTRFGRLEVLETLAHNNVYSFRADRRVRGAVHDLDGEVEFVEGTHPIVFIESGGHGVFGSQSGHARFSTQDRRFTQSTGVTYRYTGQAERPTHSNAVEVGYELLPIEEHWWRPSQQSGRAEQMFDDFFHYEPIGGRPGAAYARIPGAFRGRKQGVNKAKPFWGWHDQRTSSRNLLAPGQWGLDPAYGVSRNLQMPEPFSLEYVRNPYLDLREASRTVVEDGPVPPAAPAPTASPDPGLPTLPLKKRSDYDPAAHEGFCELRLRVDDVVDLLLKGDRLAYRLEGGRPPSDEGSVCSQPLPQVRQFRKLTVTKQEGRGEVRLLEAPLPANQHTCRIRVTDSKKSDDRYRIRVAWEWRESDRIPQPPAWPPLEGESLKVNLGQKGGGGREGVFEFKGRVDEIVLLRIRGAEVAVQTVKGRPPQVESLRMSLPMATGPAPSAVRLKQRRGRGQVLLLEKPTAGNGFVAVVQVIDSRKGDDGYQFELRWE